MKVKHKNSESKSKAKNSFGVSLMYIVNVSSCML